MEAPFQTRSVDDLYSWLDATWQAVAGCQLSVPARWAAPVFPIPAALVGMLQIVWSVWVWRNVAVRDLWLGLGSAVVVTTLPCLFTRWRWTRWALAGAFALGAAHAYLVLGSGRRWCSACSPSAPPRTRATASTSAPSQVNAIACGPRPELRSRRARADRRASTSSAPSATLGSSAAGSGDTVAGG
jgi:hypothetical protein